MGETEDAARSSSQFLHYSSRVNRLVQRIKASTVEKKALALVLITLAILAIYRTVHIWTTGFFVTDEYLYILDAIRPAIYSDRWFFGLFNIYLFQLLGIDNITKLVYLLPFYLFLWSLITILSFYGIMKLLRTEGRVMALSLVSALFLISFVLLSTGFLTEPVGLALVMAGIFFLMLFALRIEHPKRLPFYSLFSILAFAAARYTREPYAIFMLVGIVLVPIIAYRHFRNLRSLGRLARITVVVLSMIFFLVPTAFLLQHPNSIVGEVTNLSSGIGQTVLVPMTVSTQTVTSPKVVTGTTITTTTSTSTVVTGTITHTVTSIYVSTLTTSSTITQQTVQSNLILNNRLVNTVYIFLGGMILGWGPILFLFGLAGTLILLVKLLRGFDKSLALVLVLLFVSLFSYLVVSYIFSTDPSYLTLEHYSTIIRFSDTTIPAYFLAAPFIYSIFSRDRKRILSVVVILLVFTVAVVPAYEVYAASGLNLQENPFSFGFQTTGIGIRDYVQSHHADGPLNIIGFPQYDWFWTPGSANLANVHLYPYPNQTQFTKDRWTNFYVWGERLNSSNPKDPYALNERLPYLFPNILNGTTPGAQYRVVSAQVIINETSSIMVRVQLNWNSTA